MVKYLVPFKSAAIVGALPAGKKVSLDPLPFLLENKRSIVVMEGDGDPQDFVTKLLESQQKGHFPIEKLCRTYSLEEVKHAIHDLHFGKVSHEELEKYRMLTRTPGNQASDAVELSRSRDVLCDVLSTTRTMQVQTYLSFSCP
jgi:hypothetical protein